jgi:diguanylate cyclase (GGDEF)-like protein
MASVSFNRNRVKLKALFGIRARLALLALILVVPLMLERVRSLEDTRARQVAAASSEFASLAQHSADGQREVISSVEAMLKSAAYIRASAGGVGKSCLILRASLTVDLPWIRSMSIVGKNGRVQCSTLNGLVGVDLSDRPYFKKMQETRGFVLSDYLFGRASKEPTIVAAYPVAAVDQDEDAFVIATVNLDWMSLVMSNLGGRPGVSAVLVDGAGTVLAAPPDQASMIGRSLDHLPLLSGVAPHALASDKAKGSVSFIADGTQRAASFARIPGTDSRLIVTIDEAKVSASINRDIKSAYFQLAFVFVFVLIGALIAAEKLIIQPIEMMAAMTKKFGQGDWSARVSRARLPAEFVPLARAFNAMAAHLGQRERELIASNDRLTVIASIDMLSGLANRRGFQSRLDFEWLKAMQTGSEVALLMIDVDHFKLYNDTYGHPEGDLCLSRLGEALAGIADATDGFAGRYGGEEFCLLLPNFNAPRALAAGEMVRAAIQDLGMPHATSVYQSVTVSVGVACTTPSDAQAPMDLIEAADAALYAAKHRGRNAVVEHRLVRAGDAGADAMKMAG